MTVRLCVRLAAFGAAMLARPALAAEPAGPPPAPLPLVSPSPNQKLADAVVRQLQQSGQLRHYRVDVVVRGALVELSGTVSDQSQREEVLRLVQGVPGVERVIDRMGMGGAITTVQAEVPPRLPEPVPERPPQRPGEAMPPGPPPAGGAPGAAPPGGAGIPEPAPLFRAPGPNPYDLNPPKLPPYAWPTYAPYNNFSRVAVPYAYPYNAWPYIGPCYPFPKIPLGWRSVKLEWDDGYWWFSKVATKYDWWRLRYW